MPLLLKFLGYDPRPKPATVGEQLVHYREGLGWSQKRLAEALKVDPTTLSRWELGKKAPFGRYLEKVTTFIGLNRKMAVPEL